MQTIRLGSKGEAVATWQRAIGVLPDGDFGRITDAATRAWQHARGLVADGVVGPKTWGALNLPKGGTDGVPFVEAKNYTRSSRKPQQVRLFVIHTPETPEHGTVAESVARYFRDQPLHGSRDPKWCKTGPDGVVAKWSGSSCHYQVDNDSVVQSVRDHDVAWHAAAANGFSLGFELAGTAKQTPEQWADAYSEAMLRVAAKLIAAKISGDYHHIPVRRLTPDQIKIPTVAGFCGHNDVNAAFHGGRGHWDPGPHFPWDHFLGLVEDACSR